MSRRSHFDRYWHTPVFFKKNIFPVSHIHIFQELDFQLRHSESCCFQVCCQTLFSFPTRGSVIPVFKKEREREISVGCNIEWEDHGNCYDYCFHLKAYGLQVFHAITWQGRCDGITDKGDEEINWDLLKSPLALPMISIPVPFDQGRASQIHFLLYEHNLSEDNLVCNTLLSAFSDPTLISPINPWDTKIADGIYFSLLPKKPDQNTCKDACTLTWISSKNCMWKWRESVLGLFLGWQLCFLLGDFLLLVHRVPKSNNIFMVFFRALFNKMLCPHKQVKSIECKRLDWDQTKEWPCRKVNSWWAMN